jgi:hypothetical protein
LVEVKSDYIIPKDTEKMINRDHRPKRIDAVQEQAQGAEYFFYLF